MTTRGDTDVTVRRAEDVADVLAAGDVFDRPVRRDAAVSFLAQPGHHLLISYDPSGTPTGFVSGVEMVHPDKGREMFLYELGVSAEHRRRGHGRALTAALARLASERGCYGMWVLTERDNAAALATYQATGAVDDGDCVSLTWDLGSD